MTAPLAWGRFLSCQANLSRVVAVCLESSVIGVISYQTGNSRSVMRALDHLGVPCVLAEGPGDARDVRGLILPGVGSADVTMRSLRSAGWYEFLEDQVLAGGKPFLGVCVGLQVLFDHSEENDTNCLGWLPGEVRSFDSSVVRVPQMGWNSVVLQRHHPLTEFTKNGEYFYFVNSYFVEPTDSADTLGLTDHGGPFASIVARRNIMATQFHVEKSGKAGLELLQRFASLNRDDLC